MRSFLKHLPAEVALIAACCWTESGQRKAQWRELAGERLDWQKVISLAERNYVIPRLAQCLPAEAWVPRDVAEVLRVRAKMTAWRNNLLSDALAALDRKFTERNISVIHYKGPVLAASLYGDVALRTFNDLDFLVRPADLPAVLDLLRGEGYRGERKLSLAEIAHHERVQKDYLFERGPIRLEPHWSITASRFPFEMDYDGLWSRAIRVPFNDAAVLALAPADLLVVLCVVGAKGKWKRLQMVSDVANAAEKLDPEDWNAAMRSARTAGAERILLLGVLLAHELCGASLPEWVVGPARSKAIVQDLAHRVTQLLFSERRSVGWLPQSPHVFSRMLFQMRDRSRDKWLYFLRTTTTPTGLHFRRFPLSRPLFPLYRLLVPLHDYFLYPMAWCAKRVWARAAR